METGIAMAGGFKNLKQDVVRCARPLVFALAGLAVTACASADITASLNPDPPG